MKNMKMKEYKYPTRKQKNLNNYKKSNGYYN